MTTRTEVPFCSQRVPIYVDDYSSLNGNVYITTPAPNASAAVTVAVVLPPVIEQTEHTE
jgi:hypothetical protein